MKCYNTSKLTTFTEQQICLNKKYYGPKSKLQKNEESLHWIQFKGPWGGLIRQKPRSQKINFYITWALVNVFQSEAVQNQMDHLLLNVLLSQAPALWQQQCPGTDGDISNCQWYFPSELTLYRSNSSNQSTGRAPTCIPVGNEGQVRPGWSLGFLLGRQNPSGVSDPACHLQPSCDWGHPWHKAGHKGVGNFYLWNSGCSLQTRWVHLK